MDGDSAPAASASDAPRWQTLSFAPTAEREEPQLAEIRGPGSGGDKPVAESPLVVALHGRGEAGRGLEVGARAWRDDYWIDKLDDRLRRGRIEAADVNGWAEPARLAAIGRSLENEPYRGVALVCPYSPALSDRSRAGAEPFGRFVISELLPRSRQALAISGSRTTTGIDGVSMGGRLALLVGLSHPEVFGAVGALQPAVSVGEAGELADLAKTASARAPQRLRLVSSHDDPFLEAVRALAAALEARDVPHELVVTPGPHDYAYNRGPGALELLLWHERVQRGLPGP